MGLEILAWNPQRLERVVRLLSRLSLYKIDDNYSNKPINSLKNILNLGCHKHLPALIVE